MRKVKLRMNEYHKYSIIKNLVDNGGNKNNAAIKLNLSRRQIDRLIIKYKEKGKSRFVHGNRGHKPTNTLDLTLSQNIILLYQNKYYDCNFNHFKDLLEERENIKRRRTRRNLKKIKLLKKKENINKTNKEIYPSNEASVESWGV